MKPWWSRALGVFVWMVLALAPGIALAQVQARVDRNPIDLGDSVVLSIQSGGAAAAPDLGPLMQDFELLDQTSGRSLEMVNGVSSSRWSTRSPCSRGAMATWSFPHCRWASSAPRPSR